MNAPAFSVVIPLHDKRDFIGRTLESVLAQDHADFEIVVVDDGSTDGSREHVEEIGDPRLRLVLQENAGPGAARNRGVAEARHDWIAFLDGDDLWAPNHLATLADLIRALPDADAAATAFERVGPGHSTAPGAAGSGPLQPRLLDYFAEAAVGEPLWTSTVAVRRQVHRDLGGFGTFWPGEDMEYWTRLALGHAIAVTRRRTGFYVMDDQGLMKRSEKDAARRFEFQPVFATLADAIADPLQAGRRPSLLAYRRALLVSHLRQALYAGDRAAARAAVREMRRLGHRPPPHLSLLAPLAGGATMAAARLFGRVKRLAGTSR